MIKNRMERKSTGVLVGSVHLAVLFGFAVAQPLFDLLSRHPQFFVARQSMPVDIVILALLLSLLLPLLFVPMEALAALLGHPAHQWVHGVFVTALASAMLLLALRPIDSLPGAALVGAAALGGVALAIVYTRFRHVSTYLTITFPAILLFPTWFLLDAQIYKIVAEDRDREISYAKIEASVPVMMVVFDEFPLTSLLDDRNQIDPVLFPNFAALAEDSSWFRNATTVSDSTLVSVPAILTGRLPKMGEKRLPTQAEFPQNLFTLLGGSYKFRVFENVTRLCPGTQSQLSTLERIDSMIRDLAVVYAHLLLPSDLSSGLPSINQSWKYFVKGAPPQRALESDAEKKVLRDFKSDFTDRAGKFEEFINSVEASDKPPLYFVHSMLPHATWQYLPTGKYYSLRGGTPIKGAIAPDWRGKKWLDDEWLIAQGYQRHLLQIGFTDKLLGDLIGKLKEVDLYHRSLIVITADHGASFRKNDLLRGLTKTNYADIMSIPLLIKTPHQKKGVVSDRNVETIDILPTIADALGIEVPWRVDGRSALETSQPERQKKTVFAALHQQFLFDKDLQPREESWKQKLKIFGSRSWSRFFAIGPYGDLVGKAVEMVGVIEDSGLTVEVKGRSFFEDVNPESPVLLTQIEGQLSSRPARRDSPLAIAVNGVLEAVTRTSPLVSEGRGFSALVRETCFQAGKNEVEIFAVSRLRGQTRLKRIREPASLDYRIATFFEEKKERLVASDGSSLPVLPYQLAGRVAAGVSKEAAMIYIRGWALDLKDSRLPGSILIFKNGELFLSGRTYLRRPNVVKRFSNPAFLHSGFSFEFPADKFGDPAQTKIRVFAVSRSNFASELNYPQDGRSRWPFAQSRRTAERVFPYRWGSQLRFGRQGDAEWYYGWGWSNPEKGFTWTAGQQASLIMRVTPPQSPVLLRADVRPFLKGIIKQQRVVISVNGQRVGQWSILRPGFNDQTIAIPPQLWSDSKPSVITFVIMDAVSPAEAGLGSDRRVLGLAFSTLELSEVSAAQSSSEREKDTP